MMTKAGVPEIENVLADIWKDVLQRQDAIADGDSFFELGGDSVMMMMMMFKVQHAFGVDPQPEQFYANPTLSGMAESIRELGRGEDGS